MMDTLAELLEYQVHDEYRTENRPATPRQTNSLSRNRQQSDDSALVNYTFSTPISVIVPTYREAANVPLVIDRVEQVRDAHRLDLELIFVDDDSRDGIVPIVENCGRPWVKLRVRTEDRGLSPAVLEGLRFAKSPILVVMDADLIHPPEAIPRMIIQLDQGADFVIGSRYAPGGSTDDEWGVFRWINSRGATLLARPLTSACDPMAGFFAIKRATFERAERLNPVGYKIALELIVKCRAKRIAEVPIHFADRQHGESKLSFKEQLRYLQHLRRLYIFRFQRLATLIQFLLVGVSGVGVNLAVLTAALWLTWSETSAVIAGVLVSVVTNFLLNRRFTFGHVPSQPILRQFAGFVATSFVGAAVSVAATMLVARAVPALPLQAAALAGIVAGTMINFLSNYYFVFQADSQSPREAVESSALAATALRTLLVND